MNFFILLFISFFNIRLIYAIDLNMPNTSYYHLRECQQWRIRRKLKLKIEQLNNEAEYFGLRIRILEFGPSSLPKYNLTPNNIRNTKIPIINQIAFKYQKAKDFSNMSSKKYQKFSNIVKDIRKFPSLKRVNKIKTLVNSYFLLKENDYGFFLESPFKKIELVIKKYYERKNRTIEGNQFFIKFACDGTDVNTKNVKQLNFTFTLLNDNENCMSVNGNFILGMFRINKECYETLNGSLTELMQMLIPINQITLDGRKFDIVHFNGGDMKNVNLLYGINAANSNHPCLQCEWNKTLPIDISKKSKPRVFSREIISNSNGYQQTPITYIEYKRCVPEITHLVIR